MGMVLAIVDTAGTRNKGALVRITRDPTDISAGWRDVVAGRPALTVAMRSGDAGDMGIDYLVVSRSR